MDLVFNKTHIFLAETSCGKRQLFLSLKTKDIFESLTIIFEFAYSTNLVLKKYV